eukprot:GILI01006498.1.p1 GENE.GILI01006498.1~~GILI01006498.1.p1  ORF type:complete len:260 (+),score=62.48 GILI01006498.1:31-780(+)
MKSLIFAFLAATCALAAQCPTNISPVTTTIIQSFNGATTSYEWTISPTSLVSQTPADSMACSSSGYISQYTPGGSCDAVCNQQVGTPTVQGDACVYTFTDGGVRTMSLTLTCAEGVNTMNLANTVPVTQPTTGTYSYAFTGTYGGVCGDAPTNGPTDGPNGGGGGGSPACGGGCAFTIIFFVGGGLYVIGTVAWNYFKAGKRGKELAPHPEFWLMIPGLIKDGAIFSFQMVTKPCRKDGGGGGSSYTQV